jgi:hypothetical protein
MKKIIITLAALSALSTGALAAKDDNGRPYSMGTAQSVQGPVVESQALIIQKGETDADKYLNKRQLR